MNKLLLLFSQYKYIKIQRKLKIGYNRAASIVEELEKRGIIGTRGSSNKREILVDKEDIF